MGGKLHPALAFAKQVEGWSLGIFSKVDKWREPESPAPWQFMTFRQCRAWTSDWLKHNPAPKEGFLSPVLMKRFPPHVVYMSLAAWRTPLGMEYLALTNPVSTAISQQEKGIHGFWSAVLPVLFLHCSENSEWGKQGKPVRPAPRRVGEHQRFIPPDKPVQIFAGVRAGSALRQAPRVSEESISVGRSSAPHRRLRPHIRKAHWQSYWKGKPTQGEEKSMLLKWKPPQIVNGKDDDSLEAVVKFMKETNKRDKE